MPRVAAADVTPSTYGLGSGFNEELMTGLARHGHGSAYFGQSADDLMDPFREEFLTRRVDELEAAYLQAKARVAARRGDWARVESALRKAERIAAQGN